jgi:hypothetical protein
VNNNSDGRHNGQAVYSRASLSEAELEALTSSDANNKRTSDADRKFFERMPWRQWRIRPASQAEIEVSGVLQPMGEGEMPANSRLFMLVTNIKPGARLRRGFYCDPARVDIDADDRGCHRIGELLTGGAYLGVHR